MSRNPVSSGQVSDPVSAPLSLFTPLLSSRGLGWAGLGSRLLAEASSPTLHIKYRI